jgi:hypothetical protein
MNIELRHKLHKTSLSVEEIISTATSDDTEVEMAVSQMFEDWDDQNMGNDYSTYFEGAISEFSKHLGMPLYRGAFHSPDFAQWKSAMCLTAHVDQLAVWNGSSKKLYLRISQLDKEGAILVAFGSEGCKCSINKDWGCQNE